MIPSPALKRDNTPKTIIIELLLHILTLTYSIFIIILLVARRMLADLEAARDKLITSVVRHEAAGSLTLDPLLVHPLDHPAYGRSSFLLGHGVFALRLTALPLLCKGG